MTYRPKKQIICEGKDTSFGLYIFDEIVGHPDYDGNNYFATSGTYTIEDGIGLVNVGGFGRALPVGKYWFYAEAILEVSASGHGDTYSFGNITGTTPSLAWNQLNANPDVIRDFTEYTIGSNDYVRTSISFELEVTNPQHILQSKFANVITACLYQRIIVTKI